MTVKWVEGYSPDLICHKLEEAKTVDKDGKASFQGFEFTSNAIVLNSMVSFSCNIPELEKGRMINNATFGAAGKGKITPQNLLEEIGNLEKQYLREIPKKYVLVTSLSIRRFFKLRRQSINGCTITFRPAITHNFLKEIEKIKEHASYSIHGEFPQDYLVAKVVVQGKSLSEAADAVIDAIDLFRGIWNLFYNRRRVYRTSSSSRKPVNRIVLGPLHTLHFPNAKLATESWWYEPDYGGPLNAIDPSNEIEKLYRFQDHIRTLLKKSPFKAFLESAIVRYTRALDLEDWNNAFLNLWGLLETLTNTGENDTHRVTVRRTSFLYQDREYRKQILTHLRDYRNRAVHTGSGNKDIETLMYQLKSFVEAVLEFLLANKFRFKNLNQVAQFLDLPEDRTMLRNRIQLLKSALKYAGR